ncbi:MAG: hypothetical protein QOJ53_2310 [Sphingomonadales bacterium]|jgi:hypothetical protein|nr:hypothetical protein [Sphingomonadales bacterium]
MIAAVLLALLAQASATPPAQANTSVASQPPRDENRFVRFFFYRLQFFHGTAAQQDCMRAHPERTRALDARYDALERRVVALSGPVSQDSGADRGPNGFDGDCRRGMILNGYELALHDLELRLAEVER